ncbi:hypothetical protein A9Q99_19640 [Gammaproteobacteria bacterium 45_16_T64]|nr:hypothetical protein A9Q99_19640 [Gammaproteobacteria bacterium 45_16_T64]
MSVPPLPDLERENDRNSKDIARYGISIIISKASKGSKLSRFLSRLFGHIRKETTYRITTPTKTPMLNPDVIAQLSPLLDTLYPISFYDFKDINNSTGRLVATQERYYAQYFVGYCHSLGFNNGASRRCESDSYSDKAFEVLYTFAGSRLKRLVNIQ